MANLHSNWRGCKEWNDFGLPLGTTSNEACKLYDAALTQYVGWYAVDTLGGLEGTIGKLIQADPNFVMGHVVANGLELMGSGRNPDLHPDFRKSLQLMEQLASKPTISDWEKKHARAVTLCGEGFMAEASYVWEDILVDHPTDLLALKFAHDCYFYMGYQPEMRDSVARTLPHWRPSMPLYGYLMGMHAFGLCETNMYAEAEKMARKGLELNPRDGWATHSLAHVLEMEGRQAEGVSFMSSTVTDWEFCGMLACHNFWHWAVYHIERNEHQAALDIYDSQVAKRANTSDAMLDIVDGTSLLYRLEMEGVSVGDRWQDLFEACRPHVDDHLLAFNDAHLLMACLGAKKTDAVQQLMNSLAEFVKSSKGSNHGVMREVGVALCEAFVAYDNGDFAKAVNLVYPLRYKLVKIGGSNAQRDVFNQFLIHAALNSPEVAHKKIARHLLTERKALKQNAPLTDRLMAKAMAQHVN